MKNFRAVAINLDDLVLQQTLIFLVRLSGKIKFDQCCIRDRNHIVKSKHAKCATGEFEDMYTGLDIGVVWLWRFHRNKIAVFTDEKDDADIRTVRIFVELHA